MRVWEQKNDIQSPTSWLQAGVDLGAAGWLVTRLESRCENTRCEKRAPLVFGSFAIDMSFTNMVDINSSMLQAGIEPYILPKMILLPEWRDN